MSRSQKPSERKFSAIGPLAVLPLFHRLEGRKVLAVGGTVAMAWKLDLLLAAGALPVLADVPFASDVADLASKHDLGILPLERVLERLTSYALVVADVEEEGLAQRIYDMALQTGVPVNQIDRPAFSTVQFGSIVNRSPVVLGISTDGAAPVLGQAIRARLETMLPRALGQWAEAARQLRPRIAREIELPALRRAWWRQFSDHALKACGAPCAEITEQLHRPEEQGRVTLVGSGPGDPDLLTLKALRTLQNADVVLYDALVSDEVLELARREARRMPVGKRGGRPSCKQEEINRLMIRFAKEGRHVVRLKAGDPAIFSRGREEVDSLQAAGIPVTVIPGITVASAASASLGLTLTDRLRGRQLLFVSGHGRGGEMPAIDWTAVASGSTTVALYMGRRNLYRFATEALARGADPELPISIGVNVSRPDETWTHMSLHDALCSESVVDMEVPGPTLMLIGEVLADQVPIAGKRQRTDHQQATKMQLG